MAFAPRSSASVAAYCRREAPPKKRDRRLVRHNSSGLYGRHIQPKRHRDRKETSYHSQNHQAPRYGALALRGLWRLRRPAASRRRMGAEAVNPRRCSSRGRSANGPRSSRRQGDDHRICLDDLHPLRGLPRDDFRRSRKNTSTPARSISSSANTRSTRSAAAAIMLARCAGEGRYFPLVDLMFDHQANGPSPRIPTRRSSARPSGRLHQESFDACLTNQELQDGVLAVKNRGRRSSSVSSTPTFFINGKSQRGSCPSRGIRRDLAAARSRRAPASCVNSPARRGRGR